MLTTSEVGRGSVLGALIGDAAGATLEFLGRRPTADEVEQALCLPGGGVWRVAPGQITDDGEMTLALYRALVGHDKFPLDAVGSNYVEWFRSRPFDFGGTTHRALEGLDPKTESLGLLMLERTGSRNPESKANGSLMRASALGVWSAGVGIEHAVEAARLDARLTHPNPTCQWAEAAYVVAIRHLMLNPGQSDLAFQASKEVVSVQSDEGAQEVLAWLSDAKDGKLPDCHPLAGFVRIAFTRAFAHLLEQTEFTEAIRATLVGGGDTDTNACIVGGLLGALHGRKGLPSEMIESILNCDTSQGRERPEWLRPAFVLNRQVPLVSSK